MALFYSVRFSYCGHIFLEKAARAQEIQSVLEENSMVFN
jgi:hypothetical protein